MPTIIEPNKLEFKRDETALEQFSLLTLAPRLTKRVGAKQMYFDVRKLEPGKYSFPYHYHRNAEELMLVLSGTMTIRTPEGFSTIGEGQMAFFEMGETSAHQFYNHSDAPCVYLDIRTNAGIDVSVYPDSGKVNIIPFNEIYESDSKVSYNKGEEQVEEIWKRLKKE